MKIIDGLTHVAFGCEDQGSETFVVVRYLRVSAMSANKNEMEVPTARKKIMLAQGMVYDLKLR